MYVLSKLLERTYCILEAQPEILAIASMNTREMLKYQNVKLYKAMNEFGFEMFYILLNELIDVDSIQTLRKP